MLLIAGLGNPGRRYAGTRHNIGFMVADEIHRRHHFSPWRARFQGEVSEGILAGTKALLLKPATFMNESGRAVGEAMRYYKLDPADVVVVYDEIDLPPGKVRIKAGGSRPSHNGLRSVTAHIGNNYRRLRVGIGHPGQKNLVHGYVLKDFPRADRDWVDAVIGTIADRVPLLADDSDSNFMNRVHLDLVDTGLFDGDEQEPTDDKQQTGSHDKASAGRAKPGPAARSGPLSAGLRKLFGLRSED